MLSFKKICMGLTFTQMPPSRYGNIWVDWRMTNKMISNIDNMPSSGCSATLGETPQIVFPVSNSCGWKQCSPSGGPVCVGHTSGTRRHHFISNMNCIGRLCQWTFRDLMMNLPNGNISPLWAICGGNPPVTSEFPSQRPGTQSLMFSLMCAWTNGWANNRDAGDLIRHGACPLCRQCN